MSRERSEHVPRRPARPRLTLREGGTDVAVGYDKIVFNETRSRAIVEKQPVRAAHGNGGMTVAGQFRMADNTSHTTTDHDEIKKWAEQRGGKPASVQGTENKGDSGVIRLMFPDSKYSEDENLKEIGWDDFFKQFDANKLALVYQVKTSDGKESSFNKIVSRDND